MLSRNFTNTVTSPKHAQPIAESVSAQQSRNVTSSDQQKWWMRDAIISSVRADDTRAMGDLCF